MNAVVLAGGGRDAVSAGTSAVNKAFVPIAGVPMVERVLTVLRSTPSIARITVVAPESAHEDRALALAHERRIAGKRIVDSLRRGVEGYADDEMLLLVTSDAPLLQRQALEAFVAALATSPADVVYGIAEKRAHKREFPDVPHTWARMREGVYCGAAVFGIRPRALPALERFLDHLASARKSPIRLASVFGWDMVFRFALGTLSVSRAGVRARPPISRERNGKTLAGGTKLN